MNGEILNILVLGVIQFYTKKCERYNCRNFLWYIQIIELLKFINVNKKEEVFLIYISKLVNTIQILNYIQNLSY
jgi:hypothetical protein